MDREYKISRMIIAALTMIVSFIMLINEHYSVKIVGMSLFTISAFIASFLGTKVSKKMLQKGDTISSVWAKIVYYIVLFAALLAVVFILLFVFEYVTDLIPYSNELGAALGQAMLTVLIGASFLVFLVIPYFQTLIVIALRKILNKKDN